jgi:hypothetical protein
MMVKKPQDNRIKSGMIDKKGASNLEPCGIGNALNKTKGQTSRSAPNLYGYYIALYVAFLITSVYGVHTPDVTPPQVSMRLPLVVFHVQLYFGLSTMYGARSALVCAGLAGVAPKFCAIKATTAVCTL